MKLSGFQPIGLQWATMLAYGMQYMPFAIMFASICPENQEAIVFEFKCLGFKSWVCIVRTDIAQVPVAQQLEQAVF